MFLQFDKILYPEFDRIPRLPIDIWCNKLKCLITRMMKSANSDQDINFIIEDVKLVTNQLSLLCFYLSQDEVAKNICEKAIYFFYNYREITGDIRSECGIIQPYINLIRLDRFKFQNSDALSKLSTFNPFNVNDEIGILGLQVQLSSLSMPTLNLLKLCFVDESIKTFVNLKDYDRLSQFIDYLESKQEISNVPQELIEEAKTICFYHIDLINTVNYIDHLLTKKMSKEFYDIFLLKLSQVHAKLGNLDIAKLLVQKLFKNYVRSMPFIEFHHLRFGINIASGLIFFDMKKEAKELIKLLLVKNTTYNDELGQLECFFLLKEEDDFIFNWKDLLKKTHYLRFKNRFGNNIIESCSPSSMSNYVLSLSDQLLSFFKIIEKRNLKKQIKKL